MFELCREADRLNLIVPKYVLGGRTRRHWFLEPSKGWIHATVDSADNARL